MLGLYRKLSAWTKLSANRLKLGALLSRLFDLIIFLVFLGLFCSECKVGSFAFVLGVVFSSIIGPEDESEWLSKLECREEEEEDEEARNLSRRRRRKGKSYLHRRNSF